MTLQSFVKHLLTEGDKFAVSRTSKLADQGGYAVASNYGKLAAGWILNICTNCVNRVARRSHNFPARGGDFTRLLLEDTVSLHG
jgi:hypothetical protein